MSRSHNDRTAAEIREQQCIEANPDLFAKQIRGEAFTVEESQEIATCALPSQGEKEANAMACTVLLAIFIPIFLAIIIFGGYEIWKSDKEMKEEDRRWEEACRKYKKKLDHSIAEANKQAAEEEAAKRRKRGKK